MRKLTVKNFSVIQDAELEFGKITVLIGPQSSGKSLLCKLAYFLGREVTNIAIDRVVNRFDYSAFQTAVQNEFTTWFPRGGWGSERWSIVFSSGDFEITISAPPASAQFSEAVVTLADAYKSAYIKRLEETIDEEQRRGFPPLVEGLRSLAATVFMELAGRGIWDSATYIPSERSYYVDTRKGYRVLGTEADPISANFANIFADSLNPASTRPRVVKYLGGDVVSGPDGWLFSFHDGRLLPLGYLSSGSKETLPILSVLDMYEQRRRNSGSDLPNVALNGKKLYSSDDFTIEEPEASVFPQTQYDLVRELTALVNEVKFQPHFTITTHSPYILTAFNNLIKAGQTAKARPASASEIDEKIVPKQYWIEPSNFKAYAINGTNGTLKPIMDEETGLIDADYLDDVSSDIAEEFGQLLEIQYGR